jgi:hypothetical protein
LPSAHTFEILDTPVDEGDAPALDAVLIREEKQSKWHFILACRNKAPAPNRENKALER